MSILRKTLFAAFLTVAAFGSYPAKAFVINVEPDAFPSGTVINNSYPGVTLSVVGAPAQDVHSLTSGLASTGDRVFGAIGLHPVDNTFWDENIGFLRADFAASAFSVSIDLIRDDDDWGVLRAYNSSDVLLQEVLFFSNLPGVFNASINRGGTADIAYILAGSPSGTGDSILLDNLVANVVPIPAALPLFVSALLGFGLVVRRNQRAS